MLTSKIVIIIKLKQEPVGYTLIHKYKLLENFRLIYEVRRFNNNTGDLQSKYHDKKQVLLVSARWHFNHITMITKKN